MILPLKCFYIEIKLQEQIQVSKYIRAASLLKVKHINNKWALDFFSLISFTSRIRLDYQYKPEFKKKFIRLLTWKTQFSLIKQFIPENICSLLINVIFIKLKSSKKSLLVNKKLCFLLTTLPITHKKLLLLNYFHKILHCKL